MPNTIRLHRVLVAPPEKVYRAFTNPEAIAKWYPPYGFTCKIQEFDVRAGGKYKMSFINFTTQKPQSFGGTFVEVKRNELIKYLDKFDDPNMPGEMHVTMTFKKVICGTDLTIVQEGVPDVIPPEMCYLGWQQCLNQLTSLVEPDIKDQ